MCKIRNLGEVTLLSDGYYDIVIDIKEKLVR